MRSSFLATIVNLFLAIVETLLSLRFVLKFFGANTSAPFTQWIYNNTEPLLTPFVNIFPSPQIEARFTIEFTTLFAIIIYMIIGYTIIEIVEMISTAPTKRK